MVVPQVSETNLDAHRWQQFSVLPDAWKFSSYGGLGKACMLYVDWADRSARSGVGGIADSIGATPAAKRGRAQRLDRAGGADVNDPAYFVNKNAQPGTTWDMYGVKASRVVNSHVGHARAAARVPRARHLSHRQVGEERTARRRCSPPTTASS
jgi:hypothetical protein